MVALQRRFRRLHIGEARQELAAAAASSALHAAAREISSTKSGREHDAKGFVIGTGRCEMKGRDYWRVLTSQAAAGGEELRGRSVHRDGGGAGGPGLCKMQNKARFAFLNHNLVLHLQHT